MKRILLSILVIPMFLSAQVQMSNSSGSYSQNFNTLSATTTSTTWTDNSVIPNWYAQRTSTGPYNYAANTGSSSSGGLYSYGSAGSNDRALGTIGSNNTSFGGNFAHGVQLQNTGTDLINVINLTYTLEQWRNGGSNSPQDITVWFKISTTAITSLTPSVNTGWTQVSALTGSSLQVSNTAGALNGNTAVNRATLSGSIPATVPVGSFIMIKWEDPDHNGSDDALALDDVIVTWGNCPPTAGTDVITACDSITWIDGNTYTSSNNSATFNLLSSTGCDSLVTLDLTVNYSSSGFELIEACAFPYTDPNTGITYNAPDTIVNVSTTPEGCNYTFTSYVNLIPNSFVTMINPSPDLPVLFSDTFLLEGFQWYDCNAGQILPGETSDTLFLTTNGSYALIGFWPMNCVDTSNCIVVSWIGAGIDEMNTLKLSVQPNPSNGQFEILLGAFNSPVELKIFDLKGKIIYTEEMDETIHKVSVPKISSGTYLLSARSKDSVYTTRIVIE